MQTVSRMLIVDDHVALRDYLKKVITERFPRITVEEAGGEDEALAKIAASKPHLIFMDIGLPGKNGLQLTREIKANHPDIRIVILTGLGRYHKEAALESGADGFFEKGKFSLEEIFATFDPTLPSRV